MVEFGPALSRSPKFSIPELDESGLIDGGTFQMIVSKSTGTTKKAKLQNQDASH